MAQYLISLTNTLELALRSGRLPRFFVKEHLISLYEKVKSLKELMDDFPKTSGEEQMNLLESRIRDLAYITEDFVESASSDLFLDPESFFARLYPDFEEKFSHKRSELLSDSDQSLEIATSEFDSIVEGLLNYRCKMQGLVPGKYFSVGSSRPDRRGISNIVMIGFDEDMMILKHRLTGPESELQTIPIVGMGGNGKTTLAVNLHDDSLIKYHFDVRAFVTISQTYHNREVVLEILQCLGAVVDKPHKKSTEDLKLILYKELYGRRYLIVLDDMWNTDVWDDLKMIFPYAVNGSRIILTTRLLDLAVYTTSSSSPPHQISLLNEKSSWDLLCQKVFQREGCPPELEEIGRLIARNCRGLPLAISTIGGLLANSSRTREFWKYVSENLNSIAMNTDEHYSEILSLSYNHLLHHLKPCFLYFGLFPQDYDIFAPKLIKLWVAEGFIKPIRSKGLEEVAEEYLQGLIDRNLVFVRSRGSNGKIRICGIHDILRDLCRKEAQNESFLHIINKDAQSSLEDMMYCHRLSIHLKTQEVCSIAGRLCSKFRSVPVRSLLFTSHVPSTLFSNEFLQLLRVLDISRTRYSYLPVEIMLLLNLRYLSFTFCGVVPPELSQLWKLEVLNLVGDLEKFDKLLFGYYQSSCEIDMPSEILQMAQLRHVEMPIFFLPDPIEGGNSCGIMCLETLYTVANFRCTDEFVKKFPNLRKLGVYYYGDQIVDWTDYHLENLVHLSKLENLKCEFSGLPMNTWLSNRVFPQSLKKLTLIRSMLLWEDMGIIGCLPNLEVLKLKAYAVIGEVWQPVEGEFRRLKFLLIDRMNLVKWIADETHFPCLEHLNIRWCRALETIPAGIGDIATLQRISISYCRTSTSNSAMDILEEQRCMENHVLQVHVVV